MEIIKISCIFAPENKDTSYMKPSTQIINSIRELRQQGRSLNRICKELALCPAVVSRWMRAWLRGGLTTEANG